MGITIDKKDEEINDIKSESNALCTSKEKLASNIKIKNKKNIRIILILFEFPKELRQRKNY